MTFGTNKSTKKYQVFKGALFVTCQNDIFKMTKSCMIYFLTKWKICILEVQRI